MGSRSLSRDRTRGPLNWEHGVLATGSQGKSPEFYFLTFRLEMLMFCCTCVRFLFQDKYYSLDPPPTLFSCMPRRWNVFFPLMVLDYIAVFCFQPQGMACGISVVKTPSSNHWSPGNLHIELKLVCYISTISFCHTVDSLYKFCTLSPFSLITTTLFFVSMWFQLVC